MLFPLRLDETAFATSTYRPNDEHPRSFLMDLRPRYAEKRPAFSNLFWYRDSSQRLRVISPLPQTRDCLCLTVSPSQSYFGVGARCGEADASECCAISSPQGRTHQEGFSCQRVALVEVLLPSSAFPSFCRFAKCSCDERPDGSLLAFASRDVAPRIHPVTAWLLLSPSSCTRLPIRLLCKRRTHYWERCGLSTFRTDTWTG
jgi:hypothetical protein